MTERNEGRNGRLSGAMAGAIGGAAGAVAMRMMTAVGQKAGLVETPVPLQIERELEKRAGIDDRTGPGQEKALALVEHIAIGAGFGALYGLFDEALDLPTLPAGPLYGLGVYAVNFGGFGPAFGLTPAPTEEPPSAVARKVMMHGLYGAVTAAVSQRVRSALED